MKRSMHRMVAFLLACCITMTFFVTSVLASEEDGQTGDGEFIAGQQKENGDNSLGSSSKSIGDSSGGSSTKDENQEKDNEATFVFAYDEQPTSKEEVQSLVDNFDGDIDSLPKWKEAIDEDWLPVGWTQELFTDNKTKAPYWQLALQFSLMSAPTNIIDDESLRGAIAAAVDGDELVIKNDILLDSPLSIGKNLTLSAPEGEVITLTTGNHRHIEITGNDVTLVFNDVVLDGQNSGGGIYNTGTGRKLHLENAVIENCVASSGGAIIMSQTANGALTISGTSRFNNNTATIDAGGAIDVTNRTSGSPVTVLISGDFEFNNNNSSVSGGAIYAGYANVIIEGQGKISGNRTRGIGTFGGAIFVAGPLTINGTDSGAIEFSGNYAPKGGGAVQLSANPRNSGATCYFSGNVIFSGNTADGYGGAIATETAAIVISDGVVFNGNRATGEMSNVSVYGEGGAIYSWSNSAPSITISDGVSFTNNISTFQGGAIYAKGNVSLSDTRFEGNRAERPDSLVSSNLVGGGAIYVDDYAKLTMDSQVTFTGNFAPQGWYLDDDAETALVDIHNNNIQTTSFTGRYAFAYNNADVYLGGGLDDSMVRDITYLSDKNGELINKTIFFTDRPIKRPASPTRDRFFFVEWVDDATDTAWQFDTIASQDLTLYATWTMDPSFTEYTVTFESNGGSPVDAQTVYVNNTITAPNPAPTKYGYLFDDWYKDAELSELYEFSTPVTSSFTLYASWSEDPSVTRHTVTFDSRGGSAVEPQTILDGRTALRPVDPTYAGRTFEGWYTSTDLTTEYTFTEVVNSDITLYARWDDDSDPNKGKYTVTFNTKGGTPTPAPQYVVPGERAIEPSSPTKEGYTFAGWYTDESYGGSWSFEWPVNNSIILYAKWDAVEVGAKSYRMTFYANGGHFVGHGDSFTVEFLEGQTISLTSVPAIVRLDGYTATGKWYTTPECKTEDEWNFAKDIMPSDHFALYAGWIKDSDGGDGGDGNNGGGNSGGDGGDGNNGGGNSGGDGGNGNNGGGNSGGGNSSGGSDKQDVYPGDSQNTTTILDDEIPLADQLLTLIDDGDIPLGTLPKTGRTGALALAGALCATALGASILLAPRSKKEDENTSN